MYQNELCHHGVKGQRWGVRRYQNYDGTSIKKGKELANKGKEFVKNHKKLVITGAALAGTALAAVGGVHVADIFLDGRLKDTIDELVDDVFNNSNFNDVIHDVKLDIDYLINPNGEFEKPSVTEMSDSMKEHFRVPGSDMVAAPSTLGIPVPSHSAHTSQIQAPSGITSATSALGIHARRPHPHKPRIVFKSSGIGHTKEELERIQAILRNRDKLKAHVSPQEMQDLLSKLKSKYGHTKEELEQIQAILRNRDKLKMQVNPQKMQDFLNLLKSK